VEKPDAQSSSYTLSLDKNGFIPLYYQIQQALIEKIQAGELAVGDCLPSEYELARSYQVSRMTARQAPHNLKSRGYALSQKGRGTYVTRPKLEKNIMHLRGFTEDMKRRGMMPSSRLLAQTVLLAKGVLTEQL
jgi:GntR family transcriptional regulator